jgi:hypothetical protein
VNGTRRELRKRNRKRKEKEKKKKAIRHRSNGGKKRRNTRMN